jgi:hypothetical protein
MAAVSSSTTLVTVAASTTTSKDNDVKQHSRRPPLSTCPPMTLFNRMQCMGSLLLLDVGLPVVHSTASSQASSVGVAPVIERGPIAIIGSIRVPPLSWSPTTPAGDHDAAVMLLTTADATTARANALVFTDHHATLLRFNISEMNGVHVPIGAIRVTRNAANRVTGDFA